MERNEVQIGPDLEGEWRHANSRQRLIVLCHGFQSSKENETIVYMTEALNTLGYDTFTFNFSPNTRGFDIEQQVGDIMQIVEHFSEYNQIVLLAASFAAVTAAITSAQQMAVHGLITLNGFFGQGLLGDNYRRVYRKFRIVATIIPKYRRIYQYYKRQLEPAQIKIPVLVIHAEQDEYVFKQQSDWFYAQVVAPKKFITLETANHGVTEDADRDKVVSHIDTWLKKI